MTKPGKVEVSAEVASLEAASIEVRVGKLRVRSQVSATDDYGRFKIVKLGALELPVGDSVTLSLHAVKDGWQPVNVRSIKLRPAS